MQCREVADNQSTESNVKVEDEQSWRVDVA